ncbi:hypothetical protein BDR07DRAFT_1489258 [Suillus spraguei]|nr:hypothetical protein BDR07DRAFT_1489258 [Suillus spraguei]
MPRESACKELLKIIDQAELALAKLQYQDILDDWSDFDSDSGSGDSLSTTSDDDDDTIRTSVSSGNSSISSDDVALPYNRLLHTINALHGEVKRACVLQKPDEPPP